MVERRPSPKEFTETIFRPVPALVREPDALRHRHFQEAPSMLDLNRTTREVRRDAGWLLAIGMCGGRLAFAWQNTRQPHGRYPWVEESS
jgi:hypothetical protein